MSQKQLKFPIVHCTVSAYRIRCRQSSLPVSLHTFRSTAILQFVCCVLVADGVSGCVCVCVCVVVRCAECESAWHYCLYCKSCCNFVKISTLLVCLPARWSLSSVQQCHICAPQCCTTPIPAPLPLSPFWTVAMQQICRRFQPLLLAFFC